MFYKLMYLSYSFINLKLIFEVYTSYDIPFGDTHSELNISLAVGV